MLIDLRIRDDASRGGLWRIRERLYDSAWNKRRRTSTKPARPKQMRGGREGRARPPQIDQARLRGTRHESDT